MGVGSKHQAPAALRPAKRPATYCRGGWVDVRVGLAGREKSRLHRNLIPGPSQCLRVFFVDGNTVGEWRTGIE